MARVELTERALAVDGREVYLRSGEIHYFRLPRRAWEDRILAAREGGLNCVSSYIPWFWHEPEEGTLDLTGSTQPERDVLGFIAMVRRAGLYFIARPGPFINAELAFGGHPQWIFDRYPEVASRRADGRPAFWIGEGVPVPSQLHPTFLRLVERWYRQVIPEIAARTVPKGGPVLLVQPDNEPNLVFTYGLDGSLYDEHITGPSGLWARWRAAAGLVPAAAPGPDAGDARLLLDWLRFKQWHVFEFLRGLVTRMREFGVDVPFVVNEPLNRYWAWRGGEHAAFGSACRDLPVFTAGHCYFTYGGEQDALGLPVTIARMETVKMSRLPGPPAIIELGSWFNLADGNRAAPNWDAMMRTLMGCGLNGYNVYVYASGQSPPGAARIGRDYDWSTALRLDGRRDPPYEMVRRLGDFVGGWEHEILATSKRADAAVGLVSELPLLPQAARHQRRPLAEAAAAVHDNIPELLRVLTMLNVNVELVSLTHPPQHLAVQTLVIPCCGVFPREAVPVVDALLRRGGTLILYPFLPAHDAQLGAFEPFSFGVRVKEVVEPGGRGPGDFRWRPVNGREAQEVGIEGPLVTYSVDRGIDILATFRGEACAVSAPAGKGRIVVCGFLPHYFTEEAQRLYEEIFVQAAGLSRVCSASEPAVVIQRGSETHQLLAVVDVLGHRRKMRLTATTADGARTFPLSSDLVLAPSEARLLWVDLDVGDIRIRHCSSEIIPVDAGRRRFRAYGAAETPGEICVDRLARLRADGTSIAPQRVGDGWVFPYTHRAEPVILEIGDA